MAKQLDLGKELDRLYGDDPGGFVAGRNELVKRLKADDRGDEAAEVKGLKKPTRPAALVNWLSRERAKDVKALAKVAARMRDPKAGADGAKLRAAAAEEREAIEGLLAVAEEELKGRDGPASTLDRVAETLRAMASDPEVEEQVLARRLEREQEASTIGFAGLEAGGATKAKSPKSKTEKKAAKEKGPDLRALRKELKDREGEAAAAEAERDQAEQRVERAEAELSEARDALKETKSTARQARSEADKAERRLERA